MLLRILLSTFLIFVALGCYSTDSDSNEDKITIENVYHFDTLELGDSRPITGTIKSSVYLSNNDISFSVKDSNENDVSSKFKISFKELSNSKKEIILFNDLNLTLSSTSAPAGKYTFEISVSNGDLSESYSLPFIVKGLSGGITGFPYFKDSKFTFVIQKGVSTVETQEMIWTVTDYNENSQTATISNTVEPANSLPETFYFRIAQNGGLEYSSDKSTWRNLTVPASSTKVSFLFGTMAADPSSLLGNVKNETKNVTVTIPGGTDKGLQVSSEYDANSNDSYLYTDVTREQYCKTGFTYSYTFTSDHSDYPPFTYKKEVRLVAYEIHNPDGSVDKGGESKPDAPSNLKASYKKNVDSWNSSTGMYEKRTYVTLSWTDNSDNETEFKLYIKTPGNDWKTAEDAHLDNQYKTSFTPTTFPAGSFSGTLKAGYYINWVVGTYSFKLTAATLNKESDDSNIASITAY